MDPSGPRAVEERKARNGVIYGRRHADQAEENKSDNPQWNAFFALSRPNRPMRREILRNHVFG
ncbi:MAG: hypothetical protein ACKVP3_20210 [Hyphomicrobiaceae bacterium]